MATTNGAGAAPARRSGSGVPTRVTHVDELLGGHPAALRAIFESGRAPSPDELVGSWRGLFLAAEPAREVATLMRPIFQVFHGGSPIWSGKTFFADATGVNHVLGRRAVRLGVESGFSELDGAPAAIFRYDLPQHGNPWPIRNVRDELRMIGDHLALGHGMFSATAGAPRRVLAWFGLERER